MYFKKATIEDVSIIHKLMMDAFAEYANVKVPSTALLEQEDDIKSAFLHKKEGAIIAYDTDKPVGMVRFTINNQLINFYRVSVDPKVQGRGIGKQLLNFLEHYSRNIGITELVCKVRMNVSKNIKFYSDLGYVISGKKILNKPNNQLLELATMTKLIK